MTTAILENWAQLEAYSNGNVRLAGNVFNSEDTAEGTPIFTGIIASWDIVRGIVTDANGDTFLLATPCISFPAWLDKQGEKMAARWARMHLDYSAKQETSFACGFRPHTYLVSAQGRVFLGYVHHLSGGKWYASHDCEHFIGESDTQRGAVRLLVAHLYGTLTY